VSTLDRNTVARAALEVPGIPQGEDGPVFREPWEAQAFAMALSLHQRGLFTWPEWAATLADEIKRAQAAGGADNTTLTRYRAAWERAADATPHGDPIVLRAEHFEP
jgi:nitrile hydratase accessory protein